MSAAAALVESSSMVTMRARIFAVLHMVNGEMQSLGEEMLSHMVAGPCEQYGMDEYQKAARDFLRRALDHSGLNATQLARRAGLSPSTLTRPLNNPDFKFTSKQATLDKIARAAGLNESIVAPEVTTFSDLRMVPIVGQVQAGAWAEITGDVVVVGEIPIALPDYEGVELAALRVVGNSMDEFYPDGTLVVYAKAMDTSIHVGDHVVARRHKAGFVETTLKELVIEDGEIVLLPRSSDPTIQPIRFKPDRDPAQDEGVEIIGVVVATYAIRPPRSGKVVAL